MGRCVRSAHGAVILHDERPEQSVSDLRHRGAYAGIQRLQLRRSAHVRRETRLSVRSGGSLMKLLRRRSALATIVATVGLSCVFCLFSPKTVPAENSSPHDADGALQIPAMDLPLSDFVSPEFKQAYVKMVSS